MDSIGIIGAGGWGTALAAALSRKGHSVAIWAREPELADEINRNHTNSLFLPGVTLSESVRASSDISKAAAGKKTVIITVPSQHMKTVCKTLNNHIQSDTTVIHGAKGIDITSLNRMSEVIKAQIDPCDVDNVIALSGPSHAEEVGRYLPTALVAACPNSERVRLVQELLMTPELRIYTSPDIIGVELGGSLKNIIAIATGISDGLGYGDNTRAAIMTRGLAEIARLGRALGANPLTFSGLSGMGDLIVTCSSMHSRNRKAGIAIGKGQTVQNLLESTPMVIEGIPTTKAAHELAKKAGVEMPIVNKLYAILFEGANPKDSVHELMIRNATHEVDYIL